MKSLFDILKTNAVIAIMETVFVALFSFGTFAVLTHSTSLENIGVWVLLNSLLTFARIADFWSNGLSSFVGEAIGSGDQRRATMFVSTTLVSGAIGYFAIVVVAFPTLYILAGPLVGTRNLTEVRHLLPLMLTTFWLIAMAGVYQGAFLGFGKPAYKAVQNIGGAALFMAGARLFAPHYGLVGILAAQCIQGFIMFVFGVISFHFQVAGKFRTITWDHSIFRSMSIFGGKGVVLGIFQLAIEPVIRLMTNHFGGLSAVTVVDLAARLIAAVRSVIGAVGPIMVPHFAKLVASDPRAANAYFERCQRLIGALSLLAFPIMLSGLPLLGSLMLTTRASEFSIYTWILSAGWLANSLSAPTYYWLFAGRQLRIIFQSMVVLTLGALCMGSIGGLALGTPGALGGCALALTVSSLYLVVRGAPRFATWSLDALFPSLGTATLLPLAIAVCQQPFIRLVADQEMSRFFLLASYAIPPILCVIAVATLGSARMVGGLIINLNSKSI